jgi:hypothetical protein
MASKLLALWIVNGAFWSASCSPDQPQITPPPVLRRAIIDATFEGYTSAFGSCKFQSLILGFISNTASLLTGSPIYCDPGSTFQSFDTIADCCPEAGNCRPRTACYNGKYVEYQGGSAGTW